MLDIDKVLQIKEQLLKYDLISFYTSTFQRSPASRLISRGENKGDNIEVRMKESTKMLNIGRIMIL